MINIVIPMAGEGSRFTSAGYKMPKPMLNVGNKKMIEIVINNIKPDQPHQFIFICQEKHLVETELSKILKESCQQGIILPITEKTQGAAETVLFAEPYINNQHPLMIANCDQWVDININDYLDFFTRSDAKGAIMSMWADDPKWSYMNMGQDGNVLGIQEKQVVSNEASVGIYNFKQGEDFCTAAKEMIANQHRSAGEYYVAPVYNYLLQHNDFKVVTYNVGSEFNGMYGLGIPTDLVKFENSEIISKAINF